MRDEVAGRAENMLGGAVIAFELDDLGAGKILVEAQDIVHFRAAPAIDRLVVVTHTADVLRLALARCASSRSHIYCAVLVS